MSHEKTYVDIALPVPVYQMFTYMLPETLRDSAEIGMRVLVPFGKRHLTGFIVAFPAMAQVSNIRQVMDLVDDSPMINAEQLRLAEWISLYYICPLGDVLRAMVPGGTQIASQVWLIPTNKLKLITHQIHTIRSPQQQAVFEFVLNDHTPTLQRLLKHVKISNPYFTLNQLERESWISRQMEMTRPTARPKLELWVRMVIEKSALGEIIQKLEKRSPAQARCLQQLQENGEMLKYDLCQAANTSTAVINALARKELIEVFKKEVMREYQLEYNVKTRTDISLNDEQRVAVDAVSNSFARRLFDVFLLLGVTGSGKTQVYIETLKQVIQNGKTAIILVPEISLTPQTVSRFTANFPGMVAVLHSRMSVGERFDSWRRIRAGDYQIVIGPRSAIFAPLTNIGLIVVDEEHESSYKQYDSTPLYHARDVAIVRAKLNEAVVILGSATPSVESYYNARIGKYKLLTLNQRIENIPLPAVKVYDMREIPSHTLKGELRILSPLLEKAIRQKLDLNEQVILLQNRRGYSSFIMCQDCGHIERCEQCDITLTFHVSVHRLRCHYCNFIKRAPETCPACNSRELVFHGIGTQRVEEALQQTFPTARILRMDMDTTTQKQSHERMLQEFANRKYDILLGTQMVAKGLDFEGVTLVGVVSADTAMYLPDFRASERTFQLLTQVAGRAGRKGGAGDVIIQTQAPDNFGLICARTHDSVKFFASEIQHRKELSYPPFSRLVQVLVKGTDEQEVIQSINSIHDYLNHEKYPWIILGPVPAPIAKIQKYSRWHLILKVDKKNDPNGMYTHRILTTMMKTQPFVRNSDRIRISINVDPTSLL
ncbi:primosomal protein N' [candidate division KSB1 bacterium]|nr:primosomal protein N' [candidate division KSB1 bacterium]